MEDEGEVFGAAESVSELKGLRDEEGVKAQRLCQAG
jgi:hypothetical protein